MVALFFVGIAVVFVLEINAQIMLMLAVSYDCKALGVRDRTLWMLLSFFIPLCALIYLFVRKNLKKEVPKHCPNCGAASPPNAQVCLNCGNPALMDYQVVNAPSYKRSRNIYLIITVTLYIILWIATAISVGAAFSATYDNNRRNGGQDNYGFYDFNDDFGWDIEDPFARDGDDLFDNFNNFGN